MRTLGLLAISTLLLTLPGAATPMGAGLDDGLKAALDTRDVRRLERAHEVHHRDVERAAEVYRRSVERANSALARVYEPVVRRYADGGQPDLAEKLQVALIASCNEALEPNESNGAAAEANGHTQLIQSLGPVLVDARGEQFPTDILATADYVALYFSAGWCPPCKAFTPRLVKFFNENHDGGKVHVILVSSDRTKDGMYSYLRDAEMPWLAIPYDRIGETGIKQRFGVTSIPQLHVLDRDGNQVAGRNADGTRQSASQALAEFQRVLSNAAR